MNIVKKINIHHLLSLPFIVIPFLVTHRFQDPTLLIKRSGLFFLFLIIVIILALMKSSKNSISNANLKWLTGTVLFILALAITSSYNSINESESYWELLYLSGWMSIYTSFIIYSTKETMKYIIVASSVVGSLLSLLLFNDVFHWISIELPNNGPIASTFGVRNYFGQYLCFTVPASIISIFILKSNKGKLLMLICCLLTIGGLILNRNRSTWLGIFITLIVFILLNRHTILIHFQAIISSKRSLGILLGSVILVIYFTTLSVDNHWVGNKKTVWISIVDLFTHPQTIRLKMYDSSFKIIKDNPIIGVGLGNWKVLYPKYADNTNYTDQSFTRINQRPHNDFLWVLSELGVLGMIFIIGFIIYHLKLLFKILKKYKEPDKTRYLFIFCLMSLIAIGIESMFDFPRQRTMPNLYLWSIMGFIAKTNTQNTDKAKYQNTIPLALILILSLVSVFAYFDIKSNIYSQDAKYYNNNNMPRELYASSAIALSYYRNLDNAGTPIYYYMGIAKHQIGDKNSAKLLFQKALQLAPFHSGALTNYMILLGELGELTSAHKIMNIIQHVYPKMAKSRLDMAKFYIREGKNEEAEKILLELKEANLDDGQGTLDKLLIHAGKK